MSKTVSSIIDEVRVRTNTISSGEVQDSDVRTFINNFFRFSRRSYLLPWSERVSELLVFPNVYSYQAPADLVAPKEPQLQLSSTQNDTANFQTMTQREFARNLNGTNDFAVTWVRGTKLLNIRHSRTTNNGESVVSTLDSTTDNGTWTVGSDGSNLVADTGIFREGSASLRFDVTNSANLVTLTNSSLAAVNLAQSTPTTAGTDFEQNSYAFVWVYIPSGASLTSCTLRWGSGSSNYWEGTAATTQFDGQAFVAGSWNQVAFDWRTATQTGTVDETVVTYSQLRLTGASTANRWRADHVVFRKWTSFDFHFYSNQLATNSAGTNIEFVTATDNSDSVLGDEDYAEAITLWCVADAFKWKIKDRDGLAIVQPELNEALRSLKIRYPSQQGRIQTEYFSSHLLRG